MKKKTFIETQHFAILSCLSVVINIQLSIKKVGHGQQKFKNKKN